MFKKVVQSSRKGAQNRTRAFSLVEMLMTLLVASLLMAALAPVMTKKMQENVSISGFGSVIFNTGKTVYNTPGEYTFVVPDNVYELKIQAAAGGGGGGGGGSSSIYSSQRDGAVERDGG